jgi:uncharacterized protein YvpB
MLKYERINRKEGTYLKLHKSIITSAIALAFFLAIGTAASTTVFADDGSGTPETTDPSSPEEPVEPTPVLVNSVKFSKSALTLEVNKSTILKASVAPANADNTAVTYKSSNNNIATVDKNGKITAKSTVGTAIITATSTDGSNKTATVKVTVNPPKLTKALTVTKKNGAVTNVKLKNAKVTLYKNGKNVESLKIQLDAKYAKYYDVYYYANPEVYSTLPYTKNNGRAGTSGHGYKLTNVVVKIVQKGKTAPKTSSKAYHKASKSYIYKASKTVQTKKTSYYYLDAKLTKKGNRIPKGSVLKVKKFVQRSNGDKNVSIKTAYGYISNAKSTVKLSKKSEQLVMNVPFYNQNSHGYPNGCEEFSLYMALGFLGATKGNSVYQVVNAVPRVGNGGNPAYGFNGTPRNPADGSYHTIYPRAFTPYARRWAPNSRNISGASMNGFKKEILKGNPIVVWGTWGPGTSPKVVGRYYGAKRVANLHVWLVDGYANGAFHVSDPVYGKLWLSQSAVRRVYAPNKMAVAIDK